MLIWNTDSETNQMDAAFRTKWMFYENISEKNIFKSLESSFMGNKLGVQYNWKKKERKKKKMGVVKEENCF